MLLITMRELIHRLKILLKLYSEFWEMFEAFITFFL